MKYFLITLCVAALCLASLAGADRNGMHDDGHKHTGPKDGHHLFRRSPQLLQMPGAGPLLAPLQALLGPLRNALAALNPAAAAPAAAAPVAAQG